MIFKCVPKVKTELILERNHHTQIWSSTIPKKRVAKDECPRPLQNNLWLEVPEIMIFSKHPASLLKPNSEYPMSKKGQLRSGVQICTAWNDRFWFYPAWSYAFHHVLFVFLWSFFCYFLSFYFMFRLVILLEDFSCSFNLTMSTKYALLNSWFAWLQWFIGWIQSSE